MIFAGLARKHQEGWLPTMTQLEFWQRPSQIMTGNYDVGKGDPMLYPVVPNTSCIINSSSPEPPIDKDNNSTLLKLGHVSLGGTTRVYWFLRPPSLYLLHDGTFKDWVLQNDEIRVPYWWVSETEDPSYVNMHTSYALICHDQLAVPMLKSTYIAPFTRLYKAVNESNTADQPPQKKQKTGSNDMSPATKRQ